MRKLLSVILVLTLALSVCATAFAEIDYPTKTVNIYTGNPGGDTDFSARAMAAALERYFANGVKFNIVNMSGTASVPMGEILNNAPDGYSIYHRKADDAIGMVTGAMKVNPTEAMKVVACIGKCPGYIVLANKDLGVSNLQELIDLAKSKPGQIMYGTSLGSTTQVTTNLFEVNCGVSFNKFDAGGTSDRTVSLLGGHCMVTTLSYALAKDYIASGDFVVMAAFDDEPNELYESHITTFKEQGYDFTTLPIYYYWAVNPDTDDAIVQKLNEGIKWVVENDAEYAQQIATAYYMTPTYMNAADFTEYFNWQIPIIEEMLALDANN